MPIAWSIMRAAVIAALAFCLDYRAATAAAACQQYYNDTAAVPPLYGAPYDVFHAAHSLLASVDCTISTTPLTVGQPNDSTVYVYQTAYLFTSDPGASWATVTLSAASPPVGGWLAVPATVPLNLTSVQLLANWNYVAFLTARWNGTKWLMGCRDETCASPGWDILAITRQTTLTVTITPVAPQVFDNVSPSTTVATVSCAWSDASPCTAAFSLSDPAGVYKLSGSDIIVDPAGPGVGTAGSIDQISVTATQ